MDTFHQDPRTWAIPDNSSTVASIESPTKSGPSAFAPWQEVIAGLRETAFDKHRERSRCKLQMQNLIETFGMERRQEQEDLIGSLCSHLSNTCTEEGMEFKDIQKMVCRAVAELGAQLQGEMQELRNKCTSRSGCAPSMQTSGPVFIEVVERLAGVCQTLEGRIDQLEEKIKDLVANHARELASLRSASWKQVGLLDAFHLDFNKQLGQLGQHINAQEANIEQLREQADSGIMHCKTGMTNLLTKLNSVLPKVDSSFQEFVENFQAKNAISDFSSVRNCVEKLRVKPTAMPLAINSKIQSLRQDILSNGNISDSCDMIPQEQEVQEKKPPQACRFPMDTRELSDPDVHEQDAVKEESVETFSPSHPLQTPNLVQLASIIEQTCPSAETWAGSPNPISLDVAPTGGNKSPTQDSSPTGSPVSPAMAKKQDGVTTVVQPPAGSVDSQAGSHSVRVCMSPPRSVIQTTPIIRQASPPVSFHRAGPARSRSNSPIKYDTDNRGTYPVVDTRRQTLKVQVRPPLSSNEERRSTAMQHSQYSFIPNRTAITPSSPINGQGPSKIVAQCRLNSL